jgi:electron transfer flavoprotein alpha subunit
MQKILILAECHEEKSAAVNLPLLSAAKKIGAEIDFLVLSETDLPCKEIAVFDGVKNVLHLSNPRFANPIAEDFAPIIAELVKNYVFVLFPATTFGKNIMPRVAGMLGIQPLSDVTNIIDKDHFERPVYAGNAFEHIEYSEENKLISIRPTAFDAAKNNGGNANIENLSYTFNADERIKFIKLDAPKSERPELISAKVVVSGGRALKSAENFKLIEQLADKLNAAIGASRAAVDAGFVPNDYQVGQTGKIVAPNLYIAIGISGAIQHLAGIKDSKVIVAINKDEDAPIFEVADYGLVGDLFKIVPELIEKLPD